MKDIQKTQAVFRLVILISGRGSNMQTICQTFKEHPNIEVTAVISNQSDALGIEWAKHYGYETAIVEHKNYANREAFDQALKQTVQKFNPDLVILAGFMRILTPVFIDTFIGKLINIHPSLLPSFKGLNTHAQALKAGVKYHGATVHHVISDLDAGLIIDQAMVEVAPDDTQSSLAYKVLQIEHILYPRAILKVLNI